MANVVRNTHHVPLFECYSSLFFTSNVLFCYLPFDWRGTMRTAEARRQNRRLRAKHKSCLPPSPYLSLVTQLSWERGDRLGCTSGMENVLMLFPTAFKQIRWAASTMWGEWWRISFQQQKRPGGLRRLPSRDSQKSPKSKRPWPTDRAPWGEQLYPRTGHNQPNMSSPHPTPLVPLLCPASLLLAG